MTSRSLPDHLGFERRHDPESHRIERGVAVDDRPCEAIVDTATREGCDLIVVLVAP